MSERARALEDVEEGLRTLKRQVEDKAKGTSDTSRLVDAKKGLKVMEVECSRMDVEAGVLQCLLDSRAKEQRVGDDGSLVESLDESMEDSLFVMGGGDEGSLESSGG